MSKRMADCIVAYGNDLKDANLFFTALKNRTKVMLYLATKEDIERNQEKHT